MAINVKKSCIGPRNDFSCDDIRISNGIAITWVHELSYLGIFMVRSRNFKCSLTNAKRSFYRSANAIFDKIGRITPEKATLELISSKCIPVYVLIYGLEACPLLKSDLSSLDFAVNRFFMKLFRTSSIDVVKQRQYHFNLPSVYGPNVLRILIQNFMRVITC